MDAEEDPSKKGKNNGEDRQQQSREKEDQRKEAKKSLRRRLLGKFRGKKKNDTEFLLGEELDDTNSKQHDDNRIPAAGRWTCTEEVNIQGSSASGRQDIRASVDVSSISSQAGPSNRPPPLSEQHSTRSKFALHIASSVSSSSDTAEASNSPPPYYILSESNGSGDDSERPTRPRHLYRTTECDSLTGQFASPSDDSTDKSDSLAEQKLVSSSDSNFEVPAGTPLVSTTCSDSSDISDSLQNLQTGPSRGDAVGSSAALLQGSRSRGISSTTRSSEQRRTRLEVPQRKERMKTRSMTKKEMK